MDLYFGIVLLLGSLILIFIILIIKDETGDKKIVPYAVIGALVEAFFIAGIALIHEYRSPNITPMDVYRGKTELEITYRDSIAIDSTVVWKDKRE